MGALVILVSLGLGSLGFAAFAGLLAKTLNVNSSLFLALSFIGLIVFLLGLYGQINYRYRRITDVLQVNISMLFILSALAGVISALIGGGLYIFDTPGPPAIPPVDPAFPEIQSPDDYRLVKTIRTLAFGGFIGLILGILLTEAAVLGIVLNKKEIFGDLRLKSDGFIVILLPLQVIVIGLFAFYLGENLSSFGIWSSKLLFEISSVFSLGIQTIDDALKLTPIGSGICNNLYEYNSYPKSLIHNNNNICDLGSIPLIQILIIILIFLLIWMTLFYVASLGFGNLDKYAINIIFSKIRRFSIVYLVVYAVVLIPSLPFFGLVDWTSGRYFWIETVFGLFSLSVLTASLAIFSWITILLDVRSGLFNRNGVVKSSA